MIFIFFQVLASLKTAISRMKTSTNGYASYATTYSVDQSRGRLEPMRVKKHSINYIPMANIKHKPNNAEV